MNIVFFGYRDWAFSSFCSLLSKKPVSDYIFYSSNKDNILETAKQCRADYLVFVGWSWIVKKDILDKYKCLCIHPSPLPKYRGGSPIQHQIMNGEKDSAVTLFEMTESIDGGPILDQQHLSLEKDLEDIFDDIAKTAADLIYRNLLQKEMWNKRRPQNEEESTTYKRRKPKDSELKRENFVNWDLEKIYNFIRCLKDPYPNAFIVDESGNKLYFTDVRFEEAE